MKYNSLVELFFERIKKENPKNIFLYPLNTSQRSFTWAETEEYVFKLSKLIKTIITKGDRCLLLSENRPEWLISDIAIMQSQGITVPSYTTYTTQDYEYIMNDCKPSLVIVSGKKLFEKIENFSLKNEFIKKIIYFDDDGSYNSEKKIIKTSSLKNIVLKKEDKEVCREIKRSSAACIIYTSGTGGNPKGVILSHGGILSNVDGANEILRPIIKEGATFLTWLPLSHSYEHSVQFVQISVGAKVVYAESIEKLLKNISIAKPDIMTAVPRFYQNLYNKININFKSQTGLKKKIIDQTINLGIKKLLNKKMTFFEIFQNYICEKLVRKKIKNQFGGKLKAFVSGGGALDKEIGEFLNSIGLPTLQGYGLTEASPVVSCNPIHKIRIDTVGPAFSQNEVKIAEDGEILVKGENVMLGYWGKEKETNEVIKDGWLYTGDIGEITKDDGYLKITDRKKDIIVTLGGDNISPAKIENLLTNHIEIDQSLVFGDKKNYLVALLVLNKEIKSDNEKINQIINNINKNSAQIEKIKKFLVINESFTIENGLMTPTLKVKRNKVIKKYSSEIEKLY